MDWISTILAAAILALIVLGLLTRLWLRKGIGTQFNIGMTATLTLLVTALLGLKNVIPSEAVVAVITGSTGFVLGEKYGSARRGSKGTGDG